MEVLAGVGPGGVRVFCYFEVCTTIPNICSAGGQVFSGHFEPG